MSYAWKKRKKWKNFKSRKNYNKISKYQLVSTASEIARYLTTTLVFSWITIIDNAFLNFTFIKGLAIHSFLWAICYPIIGRRFPKTKGWIRSKEYFILYMKVLGVIVLIMLILTLFNILPIKIGQ